jgi:hypothetical protein
MRSHFRKTSPDGAAAQLEEWAKDGYDSMKARPAIWGAASLGIGALAGGLYALWRNKDKFEGISGLDSLWQRNGKASRRTVAARSRTKQSLRAKMKMNGAGEETAPQTAKRAKRTRRRARPAAHA